MRDQKYSDSKLRKDVLGAAMAKDLGYNNEVWNSPNNPLSAAEYHKIGLANHNTIAGQFGSDHRLGGWNKLKEKLGLETNTTYSEKEYTDEELKKDVLGAAMAKDLGYSKEVWNSPNNPLSIDEFNEIGMASDSLIAYRFSTDEGERDGWSNLKNELGIGDNSNEVHEESFPVNEETEEKIMKELTSSPDKEEDDIPDYMQP